MAKKKATKKAKKKVPKAAPVKLPEGPVRFPPPAHDDLDWESPGPAVGAGPCEVTKKNIMLPDGKILKPGQTFDPRTCGMSPARYRQLVDGAYITTCDEVEKVFR